MSDKLIFSEKDFQELFTDLHASGHWSDGKAISDALAIDSPEEILKAYRSLKSNGKVNLKEFFEKYFYESKSEETNYQSDTSKPVEEHIEKLWEVLTREADENELYSTLIPLPFPYIVPGGRFNEIYYWDSYFTMLGLVESNRIDLMESMVKNFAYMINNFGFIPNGNRTYYLGRSQPPFFSLMVQLLADQKGESILSEYLEALLKEYEFWMEGENNLDSSSNAHRRVVKLPNGSKLNRHFDNIVSPREEMYQDDVELIKEKGDRGKETLLNIRAACESGWDFSSRWCEVPDDLTTIRTTQLIPVDLNCLLYHLELTISRSYEVNNDKELSSIFRSKAEARKDALLEYCWNLETRTFHDYNFINESQTASIHAAAAFPLYFKLADEDQAKGVSDTIEKELLRDGGILTTNFESGQQWDAPNGWAPLQWMAIQGLRNYGLNHLANQIKSNWTKLNINVFKNTGKLMEKYNVEDLSLLSGGGEYPVQDGFGWTNGVLLRLLNE